MIRFVGCGLGSRLAATNPSTSGNTRKSAHTHVITAWWYVAVIRVKHAELIGLYSPSAGFKLLRGISLSSLSRLNLTTHVTPTPRRHGNVLGNFCLSLLINELVTPTISVLTFGITANSFARRLSLTCSTLSSRSARWASGTRPVDSYVNSICPEGIYSRPNLWIHPFRLNWVFPTSLSSATFSSSSWDVR